MRSWFFFSSQKILVEFRSRCPEIWIQNEWNASVLGSALPPFNFLKLKRTSVPSFFVASSCFGALHFFVTVLLKMVLTNSMLTSSLPPLIHLNTTFNPPQKSIICCDENFRTPWSRREERFSCSPSLNTAEGWGPELRGGGSFGLFVPSEIFTFGPELAAVDRTVNVNDGPASVEQRGKYPPAVLMGFFFIMIIVLNQRKFFTSALSQCLIGTAVTGGLWTWRAGKCAHGHPGNPRSNSPVSKTIRHK